MEVKTNKKLKRDSKKRDSKETQESSGEASVTSLRRSKREKKQIKTEILSDEEEEHVSPPPVKDRKNSKKKSKSGGASNSKYRYSDLNSAKTQINHIVGKYLKIRRVEKTTILKNHHFLQLAISKITQKPIPNEKPKIKKTSSEAYSLPKTTIEPVLYMCKSCSEKVTSKGFIEQMSSRELSSAVSQFILQHEWSQALKCLFLIIQYVRPTTTFFDDAEMKTMFILLLNHPGRNAELLSSLVSVILRSNDDSEIKKYLSELLLLPAKLLHPYPRKMGIKIQDTTELPAFLRSKKEINYNGSDSDE